MSNPTINSCFDIWQRGTSFNAAGLYYFADRWQQNNGGTAITMSRVVTGDTTNLPNVQYAAQAQRTNGSTSTAEVFISTSFESTNSIPFAGRTVTISWYARVGANWSGGNPGLKLFTGTGTDQNLNSGFTGSANPVTTTNTLTTTWQRFTASGTIASNVTQLAFLMQYVPTGTAGANDWIQFTGVQIDVGSVALPIRRNGATIQGELAACQRYFQLITGFGDTAGVWYTTSAASLSYKCPVLMRTTPTPTFNTTYTNAVDQVGIALRTPTGYSAAYSGITGITFLATGASGATIGYPAIYVGGTHQLSAEL
jgi:hypothetical protein